MAFESEGFSVARGPDVLWGGDIRRFRPPAGKFDGVIGGPPCQAFSSLAHLVRANGYEPKFGNLIPEFERCVLEAKPDWFLMENVPAAPAPFSRKGDDGCGGYGTKSFLLDNSALAGEGGFGLEQRRVRRFTFGIRECRSEDVPNLLRWVDLAVFLLPDDMANVNEWSKKRRQNAVTAASSLNPGCTGATKARRCKAVSAGSSVNGSGEKNPAATGGGGRYRLADACRLQGLPEDFLADAPFTAEGKLKAVANGVPLPMGRAIARAVKEALTESR